MFAGLATGAAANLDLEWKKPAQYSDVGKGISNDANFDEFSREIEKYLQNAVSRYLPDGSMLMITVTDVDLAGEIEPWHADQFYDVRIVRGVYPPRMNFEYEVQNADGKVIQSGKESLVDLDFDFNIGRRIFANDRFFYEKEMLSDWLRNDLSKSTDVSSK